MVVGFFGGKNEEEEVGNARCVCLFVCVRTRATFTGDFVIHDLQHRTAEGNDDEFTATTS